MHVYSILFKRQKKNLQKATNVWFTRCPYKDNFKNHIPKMNT